MILRGKGNGRVVRVVKEKERECTYQYQAVEDVVEEVGGGRKVSRGGEIEKEDSENRGVRGRKSGEGCDERVRY